MNFRDGEFIQVRVTDAIMGTRTFRVPTFEDAFDRLGLRRTHCQSISDGGDRLVIEEPRRCGNNPDRWSAVFHVDGTLHIPAAVVLSLYKKWIALRRKVMAWEVDGFRNRPVPSKKRTFRGVFGTPRVGCERRANNGMRRDDELSEYDLKPRPCRSLIRGYRFERPETKDVNWKRFRKTRWRDRG